MPKRPPTVLCYICGREFGSRSIGIHEPQCLKKWHFENERLPANLKRNPPMKPEISWLQTDSSCENFNDMAWKSANDNLMPCQHCQRTFLPDRLPVHQKCCKKPTIKNKDATRPETKKTRPATTAVSNKKYLTKLSSKSNVKPQIHRDITFTHAKDTLSNSSSCDNCQPENSMSDIHKRISVSDSSSTDILKQQVTYPEFKMANKNNLLACNMENKACPYQREMTNTDEAFEKQSEFNLKGSGEVMRIKCGTCGQELCDNNMNDHMTTCKPQIQTWNAMKNPVSKKLLVQANPRSQIFPIEKLEPVTACSSQFFPNYKTSGTNQKAQYPGYGIREKREMSSLNQHQQFYGKKTLSNAMNPTIENLIRQDTKICPKCSIVLPMKEFVIHQKYCRPYGKKSKPLKMVPSMPQISRPPTVMCNLCGREYGSKSIAIHEPQCLKKLRMQNENYAPRQRRAEARYLEMPIFQDMKPFMKRGPLVMAEDEQGQISGGQSFKKKRSMKAISNQRIKLFPEHSRIN